MERRKQKTMIFDDFLRFFGETATVLTTPSFDMMGLLFEPLIGSYRGI